MKANAVARHNRYSFPRRTGRTLNGGICDFMLLDSRDAARHCVNRVDVWTLMYE